MIRLFVGTSQIQLSDNERIGYTKQVNSLNDLSSRQSNFSKIFKVPKSAVNKSILDGLGNMASNSLAPYRKNEARLFVNNICLIFSGWAIVEESDQQYFELSVNDGNIDFFKLLDNVTFDNISLPEIEHTKEVPVIKANWEGENDYFKYILSDFNGEIEFDHNGTSYINTDYLIPSVSVKYLWDRIFETFGYTYSGSIFQEEEFKNLYLTYPKGVDAGATGPLAFKLTFPNYTISLLTLYSTLPLFTPKQFTEIETVVESGQIVDNPANNNIKNWECGESGNYRIRITGSMTSGVRFDGFSLFYWGININVTNSAINEADLRQPPVVAKEGETESIDIDEPVFLNAGDTVGAFYDKRYSRLIGDATDLNFEMTISKIEQTQISQEEFFKSITPKDFYREIMWRFGLTPFPSKYKRHLEFLTYKERIDGPTVDWSNKFIRQTSEKYVYDGYAKRNYFRFKYNGEGDDYNDGYIKIDNENLNDKTNVIESKTYSPEKIPATILGEVVPRFELWEKEPTENDGEVKIEYKPRDARFSFIRELVRDRVVNIGSRQLSVYDSARRVRLADQLDYSWQRVADTRYKPIRALFNNTKIIQAEFHLSESQFDAFDLKPTIYVKQLGGEFLVNEISKSDLSKKRTSLNLIKINR